MAAAAVLWICTGAVLCLLIAVDMGIFANSNPDPGSYGSSNPGAYLIVGVGVACIVLGTRLRRGSNGARVALTILGVPALVGLVTVLLIIPAIVLQFLPTSNEWFRAVNPRQYGP